MKSKNPWKDLKRIYIVFVVGACLLAIGAFVARQKQQATILEYFAWGPDNNGAAQAANLKILREGKGIDGRTINQFTDLERAELLVSAARFNTPTVVQEMIHSGIDVNSKIQYGITALHMAVALRRIDIVKVLLKNGADRNSKVLGKTPLDYLSLTDGGNNHSKVDSEIRKLLSTA